LFKNDASVTEMESRDFCEESVEMNIALLSDLVYPAMLVPKRTCKKLSQCKISPKPESKYQKRLGFLIWNEKNPE